MKGFGKDSKPKKELTRNIHKTPSKEEIINHAAQFHVKGNISKASEEFNPILSLCWSRTSPKYLSLYFEYN